MVKLNSTVSHPADGVVVSYHDYRMAIPAKPAKNIHYLILVFFVEISGRLVRQDDLRVVDQRPGDADPLLLPAGKLPRQVIQPLSQSDSRQSLARFGFVCHRMVVLGQHDVLDRIEVRNKMELLEYQTYLFPPELGQLASAKAGDVGPVNQNLTGSWMIQAPQQIHQSRFAGP